MPCSNALHIGPALTFLHSSPEQSKLVLRSIGLHDAASKVAGYSAQDGKITVRHDRKARLHKFVRWQDGKLEVVCACEDKKEALGQAAFARKAFKELENA